MRTASNLAVGYLVLQAVIGYEWFASGVTKLVHADFPAGLAAWYRHFLNSSVIPHASAFGYVIEIVELTAGVVLIAAAAILLWRRGLDSVTMRRVGGVTALAAFAGLVLAVNFVLANGVGFGPVGPDSFDEGVGLDALIVGLQLVVLAVSVRAVMRPECGLKPGRGGRADGREASAALGGSTPAVVANRSRPQGGR